MAQNPRPRSSLLDSLGEEIVRIVTPVSICMFLVVILVSVLNSSSSSSGSVTSIATIAYSETDSDSSWDKFVGALLNSLAFVAVVTVVTFVLVLLFYLRCTKFLKLYMGFSAFIVLGFMGGEWTTWVLLVAMALYDLAAVLLPVGPLRLLVELAISRDEDIPALVYEARPVTHHDSGNNGGNQRRVWRERSEPATTESENSVDRPATVPNSNSMPDSHPHSASVSDRETSLSAPLLERRASIESERRREDAALGDNLALEGMGLGSSGAIKLGLGDFIFYSVLVGRAAMYDFMTVYACYLAIMAGLGVTLMLLAFYQKALPALPVSVLLGVLFYILTRFVLEIFIVQLSSNLLMF
ncbi:hypothetical protein CRG98_031872 [Punica granatum]|uniref:Presenilin n=1 Tax=Punica granatum TaxID=22663 RepID=A0A2I0IUR9_PUNGR|nr:hypothetical protein CRG98_031872 [Punica granatum]